MAVKEHNLNFAHLKFLNFDWTEWTHIEVFEQSLLLALLSQCRKRLNCYLDLLDLLTLSDSTLDLSFDPYPAHV